jgi:hypothetical protein
MVVAPTELEHKLTNVEFRCLRRFCGGGLSPFSTSQIFSRDAKRKTNLGNVIGQRKNSPRKSWISFFTVRANKFAYTGKNAEPVAQQESG